MVTKKVLPNIIIMLVGISLFYAMFNVRFWKKDKIIEWDVISYYSYLPATFIYKDLSLEFIDSYDGKHKFTFWPSNAPNGNKVIKTTMGLSFCYAPFFFIAHITAHLKDYDTGGFSEPYRFFIQFGTIFFILLGLIFLKKVLLQFFNPMITSITIAILFIGTNLFHYSVYEPGMSHAYSFSLICIFIYFVIKWHKKPNVTMSIIIGILTGLITLIRPTNIIIVILFISWDINSTKQIRSRINTLLSNYKLLAIIILGAIIIWIPQLIYWKKITGELFYFSYGNERFFFNNPQITNGLFSFRKGWFVYTPLMFFAILGILLLFRNKNLRPLALPITLFTVINLYIVFSWWTWWYGGCFGQRALIDSYSILSLPLAAFISFTVKKKISIKLPILIIFFATVALGLFHTIQYYYGAIHWDSMTKEAYFDSFGRVKPSDRFELLISTPDYDKAVRGEKEYNTKKKNIQPATTYNTINCGAEILSNDNTHFIAKNNPDIYFEGINSRTSSEAHSGYYSLHLNTKNPYGFTYRLKNYAINDRYRISIWRKGNSHAFIVVAASDTKKLYKTTNKTLNKENDWHYLEISFIIPITMANEPILIYAWNPDSSDAYFDDIQITKLNP